MNLMMIFLGDFMQLMTAKAAKDLQVNPSIKAN